MPVAVPTRHPGEKTNLIGQKGRSVMQMMNTTQILTSADLKNSADGSPMSFAETMGAFSPFSMPRD